MPPPLKGLTCLFSTSVPRHPGLMAFIAEVAYEMFLLCLSFFRIYRLVHSGQSKLVWIIFRDNVAYLCLVTTSGLTTIFLYNLLPQKHAVLQDVLGFYAQTMAAVVTSHILLHLREYVSDGTGRGRTLADVSLTTMAFLNEDTQARNGESPEDCVI